ncbi:glycosyltransferase, partial [Candidatus Gottesmanbacteria bacterium]|nr:glycosyltransferase [Candidatus Gottesmanbacteria bacterium]
NPREVVKLLPYIEKGYDVVSGWRMRRQDPFSIIVLSTLGNWLVSWVTGRIYHDLNSPMKVYQRKALDRLPMVGSFLRFSLLFADELGLRTREVPVVHRRRRWGKSKFGIRKYLRIFYDFFLIQLLFRGSGRLRKINHSG